MKKQFVFILLLFSVLVACNKDKDTENPSVAGLMTFNLVPDQSNVGVTLSGNTLPGSPYLYQGYTGYYANIFPGNRQISSYGGGSTLMTTTDFNFSEGNYYSLFITGNNGVYNHYVVEDQFDSLNATAGRAYLRYVNAIPDSIESTVEIGEPGGTLNFSSRYGEVSDFQSVTAGSVTLTISGNGVQDTTRTITLEEKSVYTVLLSGFREATDPDKKVMIRYIENGKL